jgi:phenylpropionate dioxygenase-like ring-hydroxylating dioxygenase large terminal subunit
MQVAPLDEVFFDSLSSSMAETTRAETLPPRCYTDPAFYELEKEAVFNHEWLCAGRESWAGQPGDYFNSAIIGEPILIVRQRTGELKALSPVCQHRAMLVSEGQGHASGFLCPYHHWSYALDGRLAGAPAMERTCGFDRAQIRLPELAVEVWKGFVFVNFDRDAAPLAARLTALDEVAGHWEMEQAEGPPPDPGMRYPFNWKVMFENNNDGYHANKLHHGHRHDFVPSNLARFPELPPESAGYYRFNGTTHADASFNVTQKALMPIFPQLTAEERQQMLFANIPPTLSLVFTCDMVIYIILRADGPESHFAQIGLLYAPGAMQHPAFADRQAAILQSAMAITAQDIHVDERVQIGLRSRFAPRGRYSWQEGAQRQLNAWLVPRYQAAWKRLAKCS